MTRGKLDLNDSVVSPWFVLSAAIAVGLVEFSLFGFNFADPLINLPDGGGISAAKIISLLALATAFATNRPNFDKMGAVETWVAIVTIGLVIAPPFFPLLDALLGNEFAGLIAVVVQSAGFYALAYLG
ncbi:hypothetical protein [Halovenus marina]|uniref:hypothetical protein n=1 Tax=Halovenus marina TaxID=3396621 RepID=UPI003F55E49A